MLRRLISGYIFIFFLPVFVNAQFGGGVYYNKGTIYYPVQNEGSLASLNENGAKGGINYWFRLKNIRLEFFPELALTYYQVKPEQSDISDFSVTQLSLSLPTQIYPLDLFSDCTCPTFSNQNSILKKGLFILVVPALHRTGNQIQSSEKYLYSIGAGLGIDIGLSEVATLAPILSYHHFPGNQFSTEKEGWIEEEIQFGMRIIFRFDQQ